MLTQINLDDEQANINVLPLRQRGISGIEHDGSGCASLSFSKDGSMLAVGKKEGIVQIWDVNRMAVFWTI